MERGMIEGMIMLAVVACVTLFLGIVWLYVDFLTWIVSGERNFERFRRVSDKLLIFFAIGVLAVDYPYRNERCPEWPVFVPDDRISLCLLVPGCIIAYWYSTIRRKLGPALLEIVVNCLLLIAIVINTVIGIQEIHSLSLVACTIPLYMLVIMTLADNYRLARDGSRDGSPDGSPP
jgi:peptidoglycan/LPS O-acetylase OafA/YrhL